MLEKTALAEKESGKTKENDGHYFFDDDEEIGQDNKYLTFNISNEVYGVSIIHVTEIIEVQKITGVPDMPGYVKGIINLRGKVIPIIDLRLRFNMEEREHDNRTCIVILTIKESSIGFVVDTVLEVIDIPESNIDNPPQFKNSWKEENFILGIGKVGENVKILLDAEKIIYKGNLDKITA